ncbi:MAG: sporulation protein YunB [Caldicoprobacterales bacterium]|jgi:sporulation protein YunB|nr:sporulation protein YunB [Clostridia bacterium]MDI9511763.1 sporulation protein YunB [Bacillota bacterium]NLH59236.1 sporulation protein YunB [Clostridiales bacterium]
MKQRNRGQKFLIVIGIIVMVISLLFILVDRAIKPTIIAMSEAKVEYIAILAMNNSVSKVLDSDINYTQLSNVILDKNGKISLIQYDTIIINKLARETSTLAQDEIRSLGEEGITVPLGSVTRSKILSGMGPDIRVRMTPVGSVSVDFTDEFHAAGINQTRHKIYLLLKTQVKIVVPLGSEVINVSTRVPISESIIVGDVPQTYVNVADEDQMLNLVPIE